jgi:hypothetical protein
VGDLFRRRYAWFRGPLADLPFDEAALVALADDDARARATAGADDAACGDEATLACNEETAQCFYTDGSCDIGGGGAGVCLPGSPCDPNVFTMFTMKGACRCLKDLTNPFAPDIIPCQPGTVCVQFALPGQPVPEYGTCGQDLFGGAFMP